MSEGFMRKGTKKTVEDMRPEYDFGSMKGGVQGKYSKQYRAGTNLVLLDPKLAKAFPDDAAVNDALRAVLQITRAVRRRDNGSRQASRKPRRASATR